MVDREQPNPPPTTDPTVQTAKAIDGAVEQTHRELRYLTSLFDSRLDALQAQVDRQHQSHNDTHRVEKETVENLAATFAARRVEDQAAVDGALAAVCEAARIHDAAHEQQHIAHEKIHDATALLDEQREQAHRGVHTVEKEAITALATALAAQRVEDQHAVAVALAAGREAAQIHANAHDQQHHAHQEIHLIEKDAIEKASRELDKRLSGMNEFRDQLRDQAARFMARDLFDTKIGATDAAIESLRQAVSATRNELVSLDVFNARMVGSEKDRVELHAQVNKTDTRVTKVEVGLATRAQTGETTSARVMWAAGIAVTVIITAVIIVVNMLTAGSP